MKTNEIKKGEKIFEEGQEAKSVYLIKSGEVVIKFGQLEEKMEKNDVIGIESLINENYTESAIAHTDVKLTELTPEEFKELYSGTDVEKKAIKSFTKRTMKLLGWL
ncbi:CRP-like cAMP-binding protein [Thermosipho japonicus]|uniref:CRP-like cAMP-binding protein n=1 Tax=Thermosipho japonicus TaxID=90323 RepID=A0A841GQD2_9BACT|nr:cyclic nucleotide-binding domain-containing protein [Thermosipho japonicus]MBB6062033.1 CRP-like cAMP-binding protein [Thermosipho japonicus]